MIEQQGQTVPRGVRVLRYGVPLLAGISALVWGISIYLGELQSARMETVRNADLIRQYTERLVQTQTILQHAIRSRADSETEGFLQTEAFHRYLRDIETAQPFTEAVSVIDAGGKPVASSRSYPVGVVSPEDEYLRTVSVEGAIFVDRSLSLQGQDVLVVATPLSVGTFRGAIVSAISITVIRDFLSKAANDPGEAASLLREDGKLLVRNIPSVPIQLPPDAAVFAALRAANRGSFETVAVSDQVRRMYSFTRVGDLPLFANFGSPTSQARAGWLARVLPVWTLLAAIGCLTFVMAGQIERSVIAQFAAESGRRKLIEAEALAEQRRQLMNEMNHRVKNNLALVAALIGMQMRQQGTVNGAELQARIMAISEVHEMLHGAQGEDRLDLGDILTRLCGNPAIIPTESAIRVHCDIASGVIVSPDHATSLSLGAAELLTNAVKHAFVGRRPGTVRVALHREGPLAVMEISDDGVGFPDVPLRASGLRIVDGLVAQAGGTLERTSEAGTCVRITFPVHPVSIAVTHPHPETVVRPVRAAS